MYVTRLGTVQSYMTIDEVAWIAQVYQLFTRWIQRHSTASVGETGPLRTVKAGNVCRSERAMQSVGEGWGGQWRTGEG